MNFFRGKRRGKGLSRRIIRSYLPLITRNGERPMARLITLLTTCAVIIAAAYPAVYAYTSLV